MSESIGLYVDAMAIEAWGLTKYPLIMFNPGNNVTEFIFSIKNESENEYIFLKEIIIQDQVLERGADFDATKGRLRSGEYAVIKVRTDKIDIDKDLNLRINSYRIVVPPWKKKN